MQLAQEAEAADKVARAAAKAARDAAKAAAKAAKAAAKAAKGGAQGITEREGKHDEDSGVMHPSLFISAGIQLEEDQ